MLNSGLSQFRWLKRTLLVGFLWAGLLLCGLAVARHWNESRVLLMAIRHLLPLLIVMLLAIWVLSILSWQLVLAANGARPTGFATAARHLALLLLGKYVPGGIWGFMARLADSAARSSVTNMLMAGITEQWFGLVSIASLGALALWSAHAREPLWLMAIPVVPALALISFVALAKFLRLVKRVLPARWRGMLDAGAGRNYSPLRCAAAITALQMVVVSCMVAFIAAIAFGLGFNQALALAGDYGLSVAAGMIVIFMPGGILVREAAFVALASAWIEPQQAIALAAVLRLLFATLDLLAGIFAGALNLGARNGG